MRVLLALVLIAGCTSPLPATCVPECSAGFHCDNGSCVFDGASHDGGGGDASVGCVPACGGLTPYCDNSGRCMACTTDDNCPSGHVCKTGNCVIGCNDDARCGGKKCCSNSCVDTTSDPYNCGACGTACGGAHEQAQCNASACTLGTCDNGWGNCDGDDKNGCEANLHLDAANCTMCGMTCAFANAVSACSDGCYISACNFGWDDCNADPSDGCEASVLSDTNNCGMCGSLCKGLPNATASCVAGNCVLGICNQGFTDCDQNPQNGCESNTGSDVNNCGTCGNKCANGLVCTNGGCTCAKCNFPNATSSCVNNTCIMGACNAGFGDCNNSPNDGCEVDLSNDAKNCGSCGNVCPNNLPFCGNSMCAAQPTGCFRVSDVMQTGTKMQSTSCQSIANNGFTCNNPLIKYGNIPDGIPAQHVNDDFPTWCKQLGCKGFVNVVYGNRDYTQPYGKLFWCSSYDENFPHWCDWQDGFWYNQQLDYHPGQDNQAITQITCN